MEAVERDIDTLGRIVIPKAWRKQLGQHIILFRIGDEVRLRPRRATRFTDLPKLKIALKAPLTDWHAVEKELAE
jgi:AbrB family looped-hinge helix DNA binding protein